VLHVQSPNQTRQLGAIFGNVHGGKWFCYGNKIRDNNLSKFIVAATKNFAAATKNFAAATKCFVDRTKHFVVVT